MYRALRKKGVHKESALSPPLFVIVIDALTQHIATEGIWELSYADGLVVMAEQYGERRTES